MAAILRGLRKRDKQSYDILLVANMNHTDVSSHCLSSDQPGTTTFHLTFRHLWGYENKHLIQLQEFRIRHRTFQVRHSMFLS